jgi:hypothetical protein
LEFSSKNKPLNYKDVAKGIYVEEVFIWVLQSAKADSFAETAGRSELAMRIPVVKNT